MPNSRKDSVKHTNAHSNVTGGDAVETDGALRLTAEQKQYFGDLMPLIEVSENFAEPKSDYGVGIRKYPAAQFLVLSYSTDEGGLAFSVFLKQKRLLIGKITNDWSARIYGWSSGDWQLELIETLSEYLCKEPDVTRRSLRRYQKIILGWRASCAVDMSPLRSSSAEADTEGAEADARRDKQRKAKITRTP
jgi:hypothetical protein